MTEIPRRETEMSRAESIRLEMAGAVRLLGQGGRNVDEENTLAARRSGLSRTIVERLRWKKISRVPADVADVVREALQAQEAKQEALLAHELQITKARLALIESRLQSHSHVDRARPGQG